QLLQLRGVQRIALPTGEHRRGRAGARRAALAGRGAGRAGHALPPHRHSPADSAGLGMGAAHGMVPVPAGRLATKVAPEGLRPPSPSTGTPPTPTRRTPAGVGGVGAGTGARATNGSESAGTGFAQAPVAGGRPGGGTPSGAVSTTSPC